MGGMKGIFELCIRSFCIILGTKLRLSRSENCIFFLQNQKIVVILPLRFKNYYIPKFAALEPSTVYTFNSVFRFCDCI